MLKKPDELTQTITIECPNCDSTNWLPSGVTGDNCENCGHLFDTKYECPHCDGNKTEIDDNDPNGTKTCYYCGGKGWVTYDEVEAYREHDPNLM